MNQPKNHPRVFDTSQLSVEDKLFLQNFPLHRQRFDKIIADYKIALFTCPCCGYPTLRMKRGSYEICMLCNWEDDNQDDPDAEEIWGGPNKAYSLIEARINFRKYLIMYNPTAPTRRIGGNSNTPAKHAAKQSMIKKFELIGEAKNRETIWNLLRSIGQEVQALQAETRRKIEEYTHARKTLH